MKTTAEMIRGISLIYRHKAQLMVIFVVGMLFLFSYNFLRLERSSTSILSIEQKIQRIKNVPEVLSQNNNPTLNRQKVDWIQEIINKKITNKTDSDVPFKLPQAHSNTDQAMVEKIMKLNKMINPQIYESSQLNQDHLNPNQFNLYENQQGYVNVRKGAFGDIPNNYDMNNQNQGSWNIVAQGFARGQINENDPAQMATVQAELAKLERIIHVDLKGAVPKVEYFRGFFKMIKDFGATGILLEYEDVFPFRGKLAEAVNGEAYTMKDIEFIKKQAADNNLYIIPLVQTYGHLEWILKVKSFAHLRDHHDYPQVITQCLEESYELIFDMLDQVIEQHQDSMYFHVGLDEVYYKLMHPNCTHLQPDGFTKAFLNHLTRVAEHIRMKIPKAKILIWDDMLHNMDETTMEEFKPQIAKYEIEPMIWAYMEDVKNWFQPQLYVKYGHIFNNVWAASAYKGASGELTTVTSIKHHYLNHITWIDTILEKQRMGVCNFKGITITGWTRYDHFLQLADLLPEAVPSLIYNLQVMQLGRLSREKKSEIGQRLGCTTDIPWTPDEIFYASIQCTFPGHEIYEAILPINNIIKRSQESLEYVRKYMTPIHLPPYNYLHKSRAHECLQKLSGDYYALNQFMKTFRQAGSTIYTNDTINEWLAVYVVPYMDPVYDIISGIKAQLETDSWAPRPQKIKMKNYPEFV